MTFAVTVNGNIAVKCKRKYEQYGRIKLQIHTMYIKYL